MREACSQRDVAAEKMLRPWGMSKAGCLAARLCRSLRQEVTSMKPPYTSELLIDHVRALPPLSTSCCQQACMGCFLWPERFYHGFRLNCLSTNLNLTLSWEEFTHLQGSLESCLLFQPAHWEGVCTPRIHLLWLFSL